MSTEAISYVGRSGGIPMPLSHQWLRANLEHAALLTGGDGGWLLDDLTSSITAHFTIEGHGRLIGLLELEDTIKQTLHRIGYSDLAASFRFLAPVQTVSLVHSMLSPVIRDEKEFYRRLESSISDFHRQGVQCIHFRDLDACEAELRQASGWFSRCNRQDTKQKIVTYVRRQILALPWPQSFQCSIT